jgi:pimeloyl-ACP methyl ester carboxylesterase/GNAT superfamily N-acetyltransferase
MPASLNVAFLNSRGHRLLGGLFVPDGAGPHPTVLLLHGIPGLEKNFDLAYALREAGWNCFYFHYRGCWGSEGDYSLPGILDDIQTAIGYLCQHPAVDTTRLAGVGLSLGGWGVIGAASDERLRAIVSLNPLVDGNARPLTDDEAAHFAAPLNGITPAEVQTQWRSLTPLTEVAHKLSGRPTLLLTGDADELFPPEHERPLAEAMPFAEWKRIPGANHTFADHRKLMVRTVIDWLTRTFSPLPPLPSGLILRSPAEADHAPVLAVLREWWGGRDLSHLLPRLFFQHFNDTSFILEEDGKIAAFLIGFMSQEPGLAYIHFVGVRPDKRGSGLGRALYERFFELARARGAREVHAVTGPVNTGSIAFHQHMGFAVSEPIPDYDGTDGDRVTLKKRL